MSLNSQARPNATVSSSRPAGDRPTTSFWHKPFSATLAHMTISRVYRWLSIFPHIYSRGIRVRVIYGRFCLATAPGSCICICIASICRSSGTYILIQEGDGRWLSRYIIYYSTYIQYPRSGQFNSHSGYKKQGFLYINCSAGRPLLPVGSQPLTEQVQRC